MEQSQSDYFVLPVEVRSKILGFLDDESLLTSRLVCSDWRSIVDDVHESKTWKPYFARPCTKEELLILFGNTRTRTGFNTAEEVNQFMEDHPEDRNPFINHTLIINSTTVEQHTGLCEAFPGLVARFGIFVQHCVYFVNTKVPGSVHHISTIFQMTNLRSLTIYCAAWSRHAIEVNLNKNVVQTPKHFKSLTVLGTFSYEFLQSMSSAYGPQIKRLRYWYWPNSGNDEPQLATFPNLEEIKVCDVSRTTLLSLPMNLWPLKRLSMKMDADKKERNCLKGVLESINVFAGTLESFHLQGNKSQLLDGCYLFVRPKSSALQFPKVTDLRVPYFFKGQYVINEISRIFMNMKHLQLVDSEHMVWTLLEDRGHRIEIIGEELEPLWETLPASVEMISVRYPKYDRIPHCGLIHKYFQKRTDLNRDN